MARKLKEVPRAERREVQILGRITVEGGGNESFLCNTINMSVTGALVETSTVIPVGSVLRYSFSIPGAKMPLEVTGEVIRTAESPGKSALVSEKARGIHRGGAASTGPRMNCYGIRFLEMKDEVLKAMERFFKRP